MEISVIICCYNSESRIGPTLDSLLKQGLPEEVQVEIILVDNNCSDETVAVAGAVWNHPAWPLKIVKEPVPGLSAARDAGCRAATGTFLLFCDDDNWLASNYLQLAFDFMSNNPDCAAIGGWGDVVSDSDVEIPEWFDQFKTKYACGKTRSSGETDTLVGAGMFLRREALDRLNAQGFKSVLSDRKGKALSSGGDLELTLVLRLHGWHLWFSDELYFKHYMPEGRLNEAYLLRMCEGHGASRLVLGEYRRLLRGRFSWVPSIAWLPLVLGFRVVREALRSKRSFVGLRGAVDAATLRGAFQTELDLLKRGGVLGLVASINRNVSRQRGC